MYASLHRGTTHILVLVNGFMTNKKEIKMMVMDVEYEQGEETGRVIMEETGRVKEDGKYFLCKSFHNSETKRRIFSDFF
jgi:predicted GNAT family N-acyltransferase